MGEEYVRQILLLGYVPTLGPVVLYDDMEGLLKWTKEDGVGDSVFEKNATVAYNGSYSLHMKTRTTTATAGDLISGYRSTFQRTGGRYRIEFLMRIDASASAASTWVKVLIANGVDGKTWKISYDEVNAKWQYFEKTSGLIDIPGGGQSLVADQFHRVMFEIDENKREYISFTCDGLYVDMRGFLCDVVAGAAPVNMKVSFGLVAGAAPPGELYIEDVLVMEM